MRYGGWSGNVGSCGVTCDYMPHADVPGWHLAKDDHGCPVWVEPNVVSNSQRCGAAVVDSGTGGSDANAE